MMAGQVLGPPPACEDVVTLTTDPASGIGNVVAHRVHYFDPASGAPLAVPRKEVIHILVALSQMDAFKSAWLMDRALEAMGQGKLPGS